MRNCIIKDAKKIARKVAKNLLTEDVESIVQENVNSVSINTLDTFNLNQAIDLSKTIISEINNEYNSSKFGELASLNTSLKNKVSINLHPTARLIKAQEMLRDNKVDIEELNSFDIITSSSENLPIVLNINNIQEELESPILVTDLYGKEYDINSNDIISYDTDFGPIRYIVNENNEMIMLKENKTVSLPDSISFEEFQNIVEQNDEIINFNKPCI